MSDTEWTTRPVVTGVRAMFGNDAALQNAVAELTLQGFDRADLTLPQRAPRGADPAVAAPSPPNETDERQARTLTTSLAGAVGAMAAAGVTIATGGAAPLAVAAAVAIGGGAAGLANLGGSAVIQSGADDLHEAARSGGLELLVRTRTPALHDKAKATLTQVGADNVVDLFPERSEPPRTL